MTIKNDYEFDDVSEFSYDVLYDEETALADYLDDEALW